MSALESNSQQLK